MVDGKPIKPVIEITGYPEPKPPSCSAAQASSDRTDRAAKYLHAPQTAIRHELSYLAENSSSHHHRSHGLEEMRYPEWWLAYFGIPEASQRPVNNVTVRGRLAGLGRLASVSYLTLDAE